MKALTVILSIFVLIGVVLFFGFSKAMNKAVMKGIETFGPEITQSSVEIGDAQLSAMSGSGAIKDLLIGNPEGFNSPHAIKLGSAKVDLQVTSLFADKLVIDEIVIDGPEIIYESKFGKTNIGQLLKNVESYVGVSEEEETQEEEMKLEIGLFRLTNAKVTVSSALLQGEDLELTLPPIELTEIGAGPEGATLGDVSKRVLASINAETIAAVAGSGKTFGKQLENVGKSAKESLGNLFKGLKEAVDPDKEQ